MTVSSTPKALAATPESGPPDQHALLDALPAGVVVLNPAGNVTEVNVAARLLLGEPLVGQAWSRILARTTGSSSGGTGDLRLADGRRLQVVARNLDAGSGRVLLIADVTSQRKLEDVVARHRRLANLGEMAATLAHQIRTPLAAALLYASNAGNAALPGDRRQELLVRAMDCLHDLEFLVEDMLRFARGAGADPEAALLEDVLAGVDRAAAALLRPGQSFAAFSSAGNLRLAGNREAVTGALLNLVSNALQAAGPGARVALSAEAVQGWVELAVADNGPGVPLELRRRIFDPFFTTRSEGTGLGLAVVRSVAEAAGGQVRVEDGPGGGARFVLRLPVASEPAALPRTTGTPVAA